MNILRCLALAVLTPLLSGCFGGSADSSPRTLPPAAVTNTDVLRVGDKVTLRLAGVPDNGYIVEEQIPQNGELTVAYLKEPFNAVGKTASDLAQEIAAAYRNQRIYTTPQVTVIPEERFVNVGGDVRSPARIIYTPDLTLLSAINSCGGFTDYAKRNSVRIIRGQQVMYVNASDASRTAGADPALYPGDQVYVPRTIF